MEIARVPLVAKNWRPCLLCGLLLASKVWQDLRLRNQTSLSLIKNVNSIGNFTVLGTWKFRRYIRNFLCKQSTILKQFSAEKSSGTCMYRAVHMPSTILL